MSMIDAILGSKKKMGQAFVEGTRVPVTWLQVGPCIVTQLKSDKVDGYWAVQLGFGERNIKNVSKSLQGHFQKTSQDNSLKNNKLPRYLKEVRTESEPDVKVGDLVTGGDVLKKGDLVAVVGTSKGKGFAGVVKRWRFAGGPKTHGQSDRQRAPGSIGQGTTPGRVYKGKHMAGRMGSDRVTVENLIVVDVDPQGLLAVSGPVPGRNGSLLVIKRLARGKLQELVEEVPQSEVEQVENKEVKGEETA